MRAAGLVRRFDLSVIAMLRECDPDAASAVLSAIMALAEWSDGSRLVLRQ
jgi:hypothetical protein